ncbi:MAG: macro domain-containing protein [Planctomycetaceae bacterium]|nr:macro domain-containing protein [Planctomycetaceae bacterium]
MKTIHGDLLKLAMDGKFDVIIHGCNCQCTMGAGIAKAIKSTFPEAYDADRKTNKADRKKLGTISFATVKRDHHTITIVNGYTQFHWRGSGVRADYEAIRSVMATVKREFSGQRIGYPRIGAGLAKGDWVLISQIIDEELVGEDHTLVEYGDNQAVNRSGRLRGF